MKTIIKCIYSLFAVVSVATGEPTANAAPGDLFASINGINGGITNGAGFIYEYTADGVQSTFASGLSQPRGLAFDSGGNLFVATNFLGNGTNEGMILKIAPDGTQNVFGTIPASLFAEGVAIDRSDNVFVLAFPGRFFHSLSIIYKFTPDGRRTVFGFIGVKGSQGFALAFDSMGNLFAADAAASTIYEFAPDGTRSVFVGPEAFDAGTPVGLAFDAFGNLFVSTEAPFEPSNDDTILKFTPSAVKSTFATGLTNPRGVAFDTAGNLFVTENTFITGADYILKFTPDGMQTLFASGITGPEFLAIQPALPP